MVGLYRIAFQGWDGKRAYEEARAMGMRWWYRDLKKQLHEFAAKRSASQDRTGAISRSGRSFTLGMPERSIRPGEGTEPRTQ